MSEQKVIDVLNCHLLPNISNITCLYLKDKQLFEQLKDEQKNLEGKIIEEPDKIEPALFNIYIVLDLYLPREINTISYEYLQKISNDPYTKYSSPIVKNQLDHEIIQETKNYIKYNFIYDIKEFCDETYGEITELIDEELKIDHMEEIENDGDVDILEEAWNNYDIRIVKWKKIQNLVLFNLIPMIFSISRCFRSNIISTLIDISENLYNIVLSTDFTEKEDNGLTNIYSMLKDEIDEIIELIEFIQ